MTQADLTILKKDADAAFRDREQWRGVLQTAYSLVMPGRNPYDGNRKAPPAMDQQYSSTAMDCTFRLANRLLMELTPPDQDWASGQAGPILESMATPAQLEQLNKTLSQTMSVISMVFKSGVFVNAIWECFIDLLVSGMGVMLIQDNPLDDVEPVSFQAISQAEIAIRENDRGQLDGVFRKRKVKVRDIERIWKDAKVPAELKQQLAGKEDPEIEVVEATYANTGKDGPPWYYDVLYTGKGAPIRLVSRTMQHNCWFVPRWSKIPGSCYGPGPVILRLADIRTENKVVEMVLKNAALALAGMYLVKDDGVTNTDQIVIQSGGFIPVESTGGTMGASIAPLEVGGRAFDVSNLILDDIRSSIRKGLNDNALPPMDGKVRSATEFIERSRELTKDLGGALGRLTTDLVGLVRVVANILADRGIVPRLRLDQYFLKVQINSPLARSQQLQAVQRVIEWVQMVQALGGPQLAAYSAKLENIPHYIGQQTGVPTELMRSDDERQQLEGDVAKIMASQQAAALPPQAA